MAKPQNDLGKTKELMGALVRMKPKPHDEMKVGANKVKPPRKTARTKRKISKGPS